jgi:hypothetical protein
LLEENAETKGDGKKLPLFRIKGPRFVAQVIYLADLENKNNQWETVQRGRGGNPAHCPSVNPQLSNMVTGGLPLTDSTPLRVNKEDRRSQAGSIPPVMDDKNSHVNSEQSFKNGEMEHLWGAPYNGGIL